MRDVNVNFGVLHRTCKLLVLFCFLYISVTLVYYAKSVNFRVAFLQNQQSNAKAEPNKLELKHSGESELGVINSTEPWTKSLEQCPDPSPLLGKCTDGEVFREKNCVTLRFLCKGRRG